MRFHWVVTIGFCWLAVWSAERLNAAEGAARVAGLPAQKPRVEPQILSLFPLGAQRGSRLQVEVRGRGLEDAYAVWVDCPSLMGEMKAVEKIKPEEPDAAGRTAGPRAARNAGPLYRAAVDLAVAASAGIGTHFIRIVSPAGVSNPLPFVVHEEPLALENDLPADPELAARRLPAVPVVVSGKIDKPGEIDSYLFEADQGQELFLEVLSAGNFDPQLSIYEPSGSWFNPRDLRRLSFNDEPNAASKNLNPTLTYRFERKGRFLIVVGSFLGRGSSDCSYELRVVPAAQRNLSLAAPKRAHEVGRPWQERNFARELGLDRLRMLEARTVLVAQEKPAGQREADGAGSTGDGPISNGPGKAQPRTAGSTAELVLVSESELKGAKQLPDIPIPALIEGTIERPGDVDRFKFQVKDGARLAFEIETPAKPAPFLTPRVAVFDESGQEVLNNIYVYTYGSGEFKAYVIRAKVTFTFERGGEYRLEVQDLTSRNGGPDFRYRVLVRPQIPHVGRIDVASSFARTFDGSIKDGPEVQRLNLVPGGVKKVVVLTEQEEGYNGEVALSVEGLPPGVEVFPATETEPERPRIPDEGKKELYRPGQQVMVVLFVAASDAPAMRLPQTVRLKARPVMNGRLGPALPVQEIPLMVVKPEEPAGSNDGTQGQANPASGDES